MSAQAPARSPAASWAATSATGICVQVTWARQLERSAAVNCWDAPAVSEAVDGVTSTVSAFSGYRV
jgi:hypothetical protein